MKKECSTCHIEKELDEFSKDRNKKDGKTTRCKECTKPYSKIKNDNRQKQITDFYKMYLG